jgi:hypothetical protein
VKNRWSANWIKWPGYGKFWAQQVRDVMRRDSGEELDFRVVREGGEAVISLAVLTPEGGYRNGLAPQVRATRPDGTTSIISLPQTGAGIYQTRVSLGKSLQVERFELIDSPGLPRQASLRAGARSLYLDYADEYRALPPDIELLDALARATGGKTAPSISEVFARHGDQSRATKDLWTWLAALALVLYLLDIAVRRSALAWRWLEAGR